MADVLARSWRSIAVVLCLAAWPFAKAHLQAVAVMREVSGQPVPWVARGADGAGDDTGLQLSD